MRISQHQNTKVVGAWVAQLIEHWTSAQVIISRFMSSSPTLGLLLSAQSLLQIICLSLCPSPIHALSLSLKNKYFFKKVKTEKFKTEKEKEGYSKRYTGKY